MHFRAMQHTDLNEVVKIHQEAFPGFFLTRMGSGFLRAYYQTVLDFDASIALLACNPLSGERLGFAVGFRDPQGFYELFARRRRRLIPTILFAALRDPTLFADILLNSRRVADQARQKIDTVELSSIAVGTRGKGVGDALLKEFTARACDDDGASTLSLTTDADDNDDVRRFYEQRGFVVEGYEVRGKRRLCRYVRSLG